MSERIRNMLLEEAKSAVSSADADVARDKLAYENSVDHAKLMREELCQLELDVDEFFQATQLWPGEEPPPVGTDVLVPDDNIQKIPGRHSTGCAVKSIVIESDYGKIMTIRALAPGPVVYVNDVIIRQDHHFEYVADSKLELAVHGPTADTVFAGNVGDEIVITQAMFDRRWQQLVAIKCKISGAGMTTLSKIETGSTDNIIRGDGMPNSIFSQGPINGRYALSSEVRWEPIRGTILSIQPMCLTQEIGSGDRTPVRLDELYVERPLAVKSAAKRQ